MANNNFPPGMPFPFPFPQMQQPPNGAHQDGQQQHAPPPPVWNLPGLQQFPQPYAPPPQTGHGENQNNLPPFPSAGELPFVTRLKCSLRADRLLGVSWPPQIPPEWLQLMQSGMQSGMIPPPLPGLSFPPPSLPHTPQAPATPIAHPPPYPPQPAPTDRVQEVMDSDREDGEVSDADASSRTMANVAMRQRYPAPPRSAPQPANTPSRAGDSYNPDMPSAGQTVRHVPAARDAPQASATVNELDSVQQQREEAKQFIRLLNANNIGYRALAKEKIDGELLRGMYRSMNLPSEPEPIPPPKTNGAAATKPAVESEAVTATTAITQKVVPPVATNIGATQSAAPSPVDRKDYLARLQAAKLARKSGPAKESPPQKSPPAVASPATGVNTPQASITPTRKPQVTDEQKARQTELIKQRLEALKAQSKQTATASNNSVPKPGPSQPVTPKLQPPTSSIAAQFVPPTSFSNIPGLFMSTAASEANGSSTPSRQPHTIPQKRPAPSDTSLSTPRGSVTPYNRTFGQSPHTHQDEPIIIEVSDDDDDDESNGSDMDIDDDQVPAGSSNIRQAPMSVPGFPPRQPPAPAAASAVSTPGPQTPATLARTGELSTKEQELAALKLTLKKKLAEQKRVREEAAEAAAASAKTPQATPSKPSGTVSLPVSAVTPTLAKPSTSQADSSRDRKRRRRTEIQEQLPTLDDEIANNEAEMVRLAKDLERLRTNNKRIMQDKERLTRELEELGIDTEGMSHADMKATKEEIERAKSPEVLDVQKSVERRSLQPVSSEQSDACKANSVDGKDKTTSTTAAASLSATTSSQSITTQYGFLPGLGQTAPSISGSTDPPSVAQPAHEQHLNSVPDLPPASDFAEPAKVSTDSGTANDRASATPVDDDDEDFYSPPPPGEIVTGDEVPATHPPGTEDEHSKMAALSPSEEGEVEMSESSEEEEEYEPEEPTVEAPVVEAPVVSERNLEHSSQQVQPPPELQIEKSQSVGQSQLSTEDEEPYEPPDVDEEMAEVADAAATTAHSVAAQPEVSSPGDVDDGAMDIATSSSEDSEDSDSESEDETHSEAEGSTSSLHQMQIDANPADDLAPELQSQNAVTIVPATELPQNVRYSSS